MSESWHDYGFGICTSNLKEEISLPGLMELISQAPELKERVNTFMNNECGGAFKDSYDILTSYVEQYGIEESFMYNLLWLNQAEKEFKKVQKKGYKAMLEVTDGFHVTSYYYPDVPNCTAEALFMRIKDDIKDKFFKNAEIKYHLYKDISDFSIGEPITAAEIQN